MADARDSTIVHSFVKTEKPWRRSKRAHTCGGGRKRAARRQIKAGLPAEYTRQNGQPPENRRRRRRRRPIAAAR